MAINVSGLVAAQLANFGQPAVLTWANPGFDGSATGRRESIHVFIETKDVFLGPGQRTTTTTALMPITKSDITNAELTVGGKTYQVLSYTMVPGAYQKAVLAWG